MPDLSDSWAAMAILTAPLAMVSESRFRSLPAIQSVGSRDPLPSLSIIVPARNEAANLPHLLASLKAIVYPGPCEVIVVDDNSSDETAYVAEKFGARVVRLDHLPPGWSGKPHACHRGVQAASGEWLLFTDADTIHDPQGPASVVMLAKKGQLDGLSIFIKQVWSGSVDRLGLLAAYAGLFLTLQPNKGVLNGQYILLRRAVYEASGGFSVVAREPIEDVALGRYLRECGYRVPLFRSDDVATVRMYNDKRGLWQGLSRLGSGTLSWLGPGALVTALFITGAMLPILALANALRQGRRRTLAVLSWGAIAAGFVPWAQRFDATRLVPLVPFGALLIQAAGVWGLLRRLSRRGVRWKDRNI